MGDHDAIWHHWVGKSSICMQWVIFSWYACSHFLLTYTPLTVNWKWADRANTGHIPHHPNYYNYMYNDKFDVKEYVVVIPWKINTYYREVQSEYRNYYNTTTLLVLVLCIQNGVGEVWSSFPSLCCLPQLPLPILREIVAANTAVETETEM